MRAGGDGGGGGLVVGDSRRCWIQARFFGRGDVHELGARWRTSNAAGFLGVGGNLRREGARRWGRVRGGGVAEGVEGGLEVAPAAEEVEDCFAGGVGGCCLRGERHCPYRMSRGGVWTPRWVWDGGKGGGCDGISQTGRGGEASG